MRSARPPRASPSERNRPFRRSGSRGEGRRLSPVTINFSVSAYISVEIPRLRGNPPQKGAVVCQPPGYKMHHFAFAFKHSFDSHQARAQQRERVAPESEAGARVVGDEVFPLGWSGKRGRSLPHRRVAQDMRTGFDSDDLPASVVPMAGKRLQRAGGRQALKVVPIELGAARKILDAVERSDFSRGD